MDKLDNKDINTTYTLQGSIKCTCIYNGIFYHRLYMYYTKKDAIASFKQWVLENSQ